MTLLGMLGLSSGTVLQKHWAGAADVRVAAAVQSVTGAALVLPAVAVFGGRFDVSLQLVLSRRLARAGAWAIVTLLLLVHLLRGHAASTVGALLLVVPAVTAIASAPALGEALHPASLLGMVVAMGGVGAVIRRETSSSRPSASRRETPSSRPSSGGPLLGRSRPRGALAGAPAPLAARRGLQPAPFVAGAPRMVVAYAVASAWIPCSIAGSAAIP